MSRTPSTAGMPVPDVDRPVQVPRGAPYRDSTGSADLLPGDGGPASSWPGCTNLSVADAILHTVVYGDLFDYPLTVAQIHRFLAGCAAPLALVEETLAQDAWLRARLGSIPPFWFLAGRDHLVELRREREAYARSLWPLARRYGHALACFPFVEMVAVSGSLTMDNVKTAHDDVDYMIVARRGRVWFVRGEALLLARLARRLGFEPCPNYVLAEHRLALDETDHFTARELAQLVPLTGQDVYGALLDANGWATRFLPNADLHDRRARDEPGWAGLAAKRLAETALRGSIGDALEGWERGRKIPRLRLEAARRGGSETLFGPEVCKGHQHGHALQARQRYTLLLESLGMLSRSG